MEYVVYSGIVGIFVSVVAIWVFLCCESIDFKHLLGVEWESWS